MGPGPEVKEGDSTAVSVGAVAALLSSAWCCCFTCWCWWVGEGAGAGTDTLDLQTLELASLTLSLVFSATSLREDSASFAAAVSRSRRGEE